MKSSKSEETYCHFCGIRINPRFCFCKECADEYDLLRPLSEWPTWARELKRSLDREYKRGILFRNSAVDFDTDDGEEPDWIQRAAYDKWILERAVLTEEEVFDKYELSAEEYNIVITDDLRGLAEDLNIGYSAAKMRRKRLLDRLKTNNQTTLNTKPTESE